MAIIPILLVNTLQILNTYLLYPYKLETSGILLLATLQLIVVAITIRTLVIVSIPAQPHQHYFKLQFPRIQKMAASGFMSEGIFRDLQQKIDEDAEVKDAIRAILKDLERQQRVAGATLGRCHNTRSTERKSLFTLFYWVVQEQCKLGIWYR